MKRCSRCGETKARAEYQRDRSARDGLQARCRPCQNEANAVSLAKKTPEARRAKQQKDTASQRRKTAFARAVRRDGRLTKAETAARDKVRQKVRFQRYQERHAERLAFEKAVRRDNRLTPAEKQAKYVVRKSWQRKQWAMRHPEQDAIYRYTVDLRRRGRRRQAVGHTSTRQLQARWAYYGGRCWMCRAAATETDHVIAVALGGSEWPANLRPACGPCNRTKNAKPLAEVLALVS
jgi:5-methylcytosine-specific restriction endonuclease McrA